MSSQIISGVIIIECSIPQLFPKVSTTVTLTTTSPTLLNNTLPLVSIVANSLPETILNDFDTISL